MLIIPAVDIKNGKCVRLLQGKMDEETVFSNEPYKMAQKWEKEGAKLIHLVDLDGAIKKKPINLECIKQIVENVKVPLQLGGGIRNLSTIEEYINLGISKIIIGSEAIHNPEFVKESCKKFPGKIVVGIDAKKGYVAIEGWTKITKVKAVEIAKKFEDYGVCAINFTDIEKDGMQQGVNIEETIKMAQNLSIPIIASGGVSNIDDIKKIIPLKKYGIEGIISGRALYEGTLSLKEAIEEIAKFS